MASGDSSSKSEEKDSGPTGEGKSEGDVDFKDLVSIVGWKTWVDRGG